MLPEIQVTVTNLLHSIILIPYYDIQSYVKLAEITEHCARTGEEEHVQGRLDGVLVDRHVLLDTGV